MREKLEDAAYYVTLGLGAVFLSFIFFKLFIEPLLSILDTIGV